MPQQRAGLGAPLFFNDTATTEIYTLSLHDALPILPPCTTTVASILPWRLRPMPTRSEEHTSELQSQSNIVCRLLLEKKKSSALRIIAYRAESLECGLGMSQRLSVSADGDARSFSAK